MVGRIVSINPNKHSGGLATGDLVVGEILISCNKCYACRKGKINCCRNLKVFGFQIPGCFAEYAAYPIKNLHKIPDNISVDEAVLVEPYSIGHHIIRRSQVEPDDTVLVIGAGTIGLTVVDILQTMRIKTIVADISPFKLGIAKKIGASVCIDSSKEDLLERILDITDGEGVGVVYEATGNAGVMGKSQDYVAAGGTIVLAGITGEDITFNGRLVTKKELTILGSRNASGDFEPIIRFLSEGKLHPKDLLTKVFKLEDAPAAFDYIHKHNAAEIKIAISMVDENPEEEREKA
jgi:threonine dehydrogenase-like Zn-dependent dehydrogenase